ncbi:MAG: hypothetical protein EZS28_033070 [Streblomastix strix]|uniref:Uncharacterized protein n=1 Tax=Streblomastix strix TaxID=222440 RepID=A0A5J4UME9_9EUKA|nr:MAG: hypothetical protein EZS28_033070 [Streblomastix strix]
MSTITDASFVKLRADDSVVLLGAGGTKPISEFVSAPTDLSSYNNKNETYSITKDDKKLALKADKTELIDSYTKTESDSKYVDMTTDQTIDGNKTFSLQVKATTFKIHGYSSDYVVMSGFMKNKSHFVQTDEVDQTVAGTKTFSNNITAPAFVKSDGTNQEVLLANGSTKPLSEFSGGGGDISNYVKKIGADVYKLLMEYQEKEKMRRKNRKMMMITQQEANIIIKQILLQIRIEYERQDKTHKAQEEDYYTLIHSEQKMMIHNYQHIRHIPHGAKSVTLLHQSSIISIKQ